MRKEHTPAAVGGSSLLVIFAVLCLTIFALLSLSTVQADGRLTNLRTDAVRAYYEAEEEAERILARLRCGKSVDGVTLTEEGYHYSCEVSDTQRLVVTVAIEDDGFEILQWQIVSVAEWETDDSLRVWDGTDGVAE